jgi:hypothetical protein
VKCEGDGGKCRLKQKCEYACSLRVQPVVDALAARDDAYRPQLQDIGRSIGYGNAQHILGQLWDEMLTEKYDIAGRGAMGVTASERAAYKRGWDDCVEAWAKHMKGMVRALERKRP